MSEAAPGVPRRTAGGLRRLRTAWRGLAPEQRLVAYAAVALFLTMFLPWYSTTFVAPVKVSGRVVTGHDRQSAIGAFSWVEAAVLLVALGVLALLFARGEKRVFHLPGGDGAVLTGAGIWACVLIVWRFFDKPDLGQGVSVGLEWGIFVALIAAALLALAGNNVRAAHRPEPSRAPPEPPPEPGAPVEVHIPESRPHLDETRVMADRAQTSAARRRTSIPLSRETAAEDTAEFRAVSPAPDEEETRTLPDAEETQALPERGPDEEETQALPDGGDEDETRPLPPPEQRD